MGRRGVAPEHTGAVNVSGDGLWRARFSQLDSLFDVPVPPE